MQITHNPIQTFTCRYDAKEDRLVLTLNYEDIQSRVDFWITRSFLLKLLPFFFDYTMTTSPKVEDKILADVPQITDTPLYALTYKSPILLESIDFQKIEQNLKLVFKNIEKSIYYESVMDALMMEKFVKLVLSSVPKYDWGVYNI